MMGEDLASGGGGDGLRTIRAAIVGTGNIAGAHVEALRRMGRRAEVVAAVDVDGARAGAFCSEHGISKSFEDTEEMLKEEAPDLVHVCTPPQSHREVSVQCMEAGAWVLCEKPLCASLEEMDAIEAAERATGKFCSSVYQWRFGFDLLRRAGTSAGRAVPDHLVQGCGLLQRALAREVGDGTRWGHHGPGHTRYGSVPVVAWRLAGG